MTRRRPLIAIDAKILQTRLLLEIYVAMHAHAGNAATACQAMSGVVHFDLCCHCRRHVGAAAIACEIFVPESILTLFTAIQAHVGVVATACQAVPGVRLPCAALPGAAGNAKATDVAPGRPAQASLPGHVASAASSAPAAAAAATRAIP